MTTPAIEKATFNRPQGMCLDGETLYVADTENHAIRAVDLKERTVTTIAGIGSQARGIPHPGAFGPARTTPLCSPWDVIQLAGDKAIYIAMAGTHQIWKLDLGSETVSVFAGSGIENITDGPRPSANFAQPSGLATDGENLFVADSEVSGVRVITGIRRRQPAVRTIVGQGLFEFGDKDGRGADRPAPALPGAGLCRRPPLHRRHLQQQDQDLRAQEPLGPHLGRLAQSRETAMTRRTFTSPAV